MELKRPALGDPVPDQHCNPTWKAALRHNTEYQVAFRYGYRLSHLPHDASPELGKVP